MNNSSSLSLSRWTALALIAGGALGLVAGCSSDSNDAPSPPVINTGGSGGKSGGEAGEPNSDAGAPASQGGNSNSNGGTGPSGDAGEAGQGGAAGANVAGGSTGGSGGTPASCPTTDVGFYNQVSTSQKSAFDNVKRLGTTTLPALP